MKSLVVFLSVAALAYSSPVPQDESVFKLVLGNFVNCMNSDLNLCLQEHALRAANTLRSARQLKIYEGVTLLNNAPREAKSLESLSDDLTLRKKQVTELLKDQALGLLQNSDLEISYGGEEEDESRALGDAEEGRNKKKKQIKKKIKMLMPLLMLLKAKAIVAAIVSLIVIAISVFKLAAIAKIAFLVKVISFIKMLLAKKGHEDHGWAPAPEEHGHGQGWESQGWGRSRNEASDMAYSAYKQH